MDTLLTKDQENIIRDELKKRQKLKRMLVIKAP